MCATVTVADKERRRYDTHEPIRLAFVYQPTYRKEKKKEQAIGRNAASPVQAAETR